MKKRVAFLVILTLMALSLNVFVYADPYIPPPAEPTFIVLPEPVNPLILPDNIILPASQN